MYQHSHHRLAATALAICLATASACAPVDISPRYATHDLNGLAFPGTPCPARLFTNIVRLSYQELVYAYQLLPNVAKLPSGRRLSAFYAAYNDTVYIDSSIRVDTVEWYLTVCHELWHRDKGNWHK